MVAKQSIESAAFKAFLGTMKRKHVLDDQSSLEQEMAFNTNPKNAKVWGQEDFKDLYSRDDYKEGKQGATKTCHVKCHNGKDFNYIVVKRHQTNGYIDEHAYNPDYFHTGNQLIDEIRCWERFAKEPEADFLCPILKYFTSKSDKVTEISEKMQDNVVIIAQKAIKVGTAKRMCEKAAEMNGYGSGDISAIERLDDMERFSRKMHWRDALDNSGNCGVIYDYAKQEYKAVFIDYAL